jgi:uncharacterized protein YciI
VTGLDFREQPGVGDHIQHYSILHEQGKLFIGGPYIDQDSGGMMVAKASVKREDLEKFASVDPAITSGLLKYEIKSWFLAMQSLE